MKDPKRRPTHYRVISVAVYETDLAQWDAAVEQLKSEGYTKATRSSLLRLAMSQLDLSKLGEPGASRDVG